MFVTVIAILLILLIKFITEIMLLREGGLASAMVPLITYAIFNVDFLWITICNMVSLVLSLISLNLHFGFSDYSSEEIVIFVIVYFAFILAISLISGLIGYQLERSERNQFKLVAKIES
jgi:heme/copper-type cytochrome/quinol oxidase subunit 1